MKIYWPILSGLLLLTGCADQSGAGNSSVLNAEIRGISPEAAVSIAKWELFHKSEVQNYDVTVNETENQWDVRFYTKCTGCMDGEPDILINKYTGQIERVFPYGEPPKRPEEQEAPGNR